jgi:amidophosphoribosyltransferase
MPDQDKLLASHMSPEQMRAYLGVDSLAFISIDGLYRALGETGRDPVNPQFTDHYFTGDYPTAITDLVGEAAKQLSLLAEAS